MVTTRINGGFSSASVAVALVVVPVSTFPGIFYVVFMIFTTAVEAITSSGVLLKLVLLPVGGAVSVRTFYS